MKTKTALALLSFMAPASAHHFMGDEVPRTWIEGFLSGLGHPLIGADHLAFIVAAGFFAALMARGLWGIAALIAGSLAGAALHLAGVELPGGEAAIAVSVIIVAALVLARSSVELQWLIGGMALAGVLHGHAYAESIFGAEPAPLAAYLAGFSLIQLVVATAAFMVHGRLPRAAVTAVGGAAAVIGVFFLIGA